MAASDGLSDADWAIWEPFFPPERGRVGQPAKVSTRLFLDALLWMTGEGARWRALPERFGSWNTVWRRFARWRDQGVFEAAFAAMAEAGVAQERAQMLDSTVIRAHQHAAGARRVKGGREAQLSRSGDHAAASRTRNRVGRLVSKLKQFRRVATRYDQTAASFLAFVELAALRIWTRYVHAP
jgi:transposase